MISLTRRAWLLSTGLLTAAAAIVSTTPARADTPYALEQPLRELYGALEATMRTGRAAEFQQRFDQLAPVLDQAFDLETILKVSVGLRWDSMDANVRADLLKVYRRFTVATYVANFEKYAGERFRILPGWRDTAGDRIVATEIISGNGDHLRLDYVMHETAGTWRAVDVLLGGSISRVAVQRSDFRKTLANGNVNALITGLRRKIADLSDGALNS